MLNGTGVTHLARGCRDQAAPVPATAGDRRERSVQTHRRTIVALPRGHRAAAVHVARALHVSRAVDRPPITDAIGRVLGHERRRQVVLCRRDRHRRGPTSSRRRIGCRLRLTGDGGHICRTFRRAARATRADRRQPGAAPGPGLPRHAAERDGPRSGPRTGRDTPSGSAWRRCGAPTCRVPRTPREIVAERVGLAAASGPAAARGEPRGLGGPPVPRDRARGSGRLCGVAAGRAPASAFPAANPCRSTPTGSGRRCWRSETAARCRRSWSATVGSIRMVLCRRDPRGLDAFHEYDVPNTGVVEL